MEQNTKDKRNQWHPAFYGAMHLEFQENKKDLEFTEELILNTLPLRVDLLIVKKNHPCIIKNEIPLDDVTLSFVRQRKPLKLLEKLSNENFYIEEKHQGIYYIIKDGFIQIQLIVLKEISQENHIWLSSLCEKISRQHAAKLLEKTYRLKDPDDKNYADSVWEIVGAVNKDIILQVREEEQMYRVFAEIMKPEIDAMIKEANENGYSSGYDNGYDSGYGNGLCENILSLLEDFGEVTEEIKNYILSEKDIRKLKTWNKIAARAKSIEDFYKKIQE